MTFSKRLKKLRTDNHLTQTQLAELIGVTYAAIQKYERGVGKPRAKNLEKLCKVFDVNSSYLLGETNIQQQGLINKIFEKLSEQEQLEVVEFAQQLLEQKNQQSLD